MQTHIIYRKELFLKTMVYMVILTSLSLIAYYEFKSYKLAGILLIIMVIPILLLGMLLNILSKKILIQFESDRFTTVINAKAGKEHKKEFNLRELKSYSIQIPNDRFCTITFRMRNGKTIEYSFFQRKQSEDDSETLEIINTFHKLIENYNQSEAATIERIKFLPSFYATNAGLFVIIALSVSLLLAITWILLYKEKAVPFTFLLSFILIAQLFIKRSKEMAYYKKQVDLNRLSNGDLP